MESSRTLYYSDLVALVVAIASDPKDLGEPIGENMAEMYM